MVLNLVIYRNFFHLQIPQYDNLYLDMNSIIHTCSHPTDSDVHFRIGKKEFSDEDIFENVSRYVEIIFRIVKPLEILFLAFDGVAPRAKMNQQRAHRFRVARDLDNSLLERDNLPTDKLFDANSITPGTVFMADLIDHMKHFIAYKVSTDPLWQKCKIILSGSEVFKLLLAFWMYYSIAYHMKKMIKIVFFRLQEKANIKLCNLLDFTKHSQIIIQILDTVCIVWMRI